MKTEAGLMLVMGIVFLFGCTGNGDVVYDCSKCNVTNDCSKCAADCDKCGPGMTMIVPTACTDELCKISVTQGWAKELGFELSVYKADWAQGPIVLLYEEERTGILNPASKMDFMKTTCDFDKNKKACDLYQAEFENSRKNIETCLKNSSVSLDTVAFYYTSTCPHCANMKPWVQSTESKGYKFLWAQADDPDNANMTIAQQCLSTLADFSAGVPQFICPANGKVQLGEFPSEDAMLSFAKNCVTAAKTG